MKKWDWDYILVFVFLMLFFWFSFFLGYSAGKDETSFSFQGLPEDAVIHFEVDKGGAD